MAVHSPPVSGQKLVPEPQPARHPGAGPAIWNVRWAGSHLRSDLAASRPAPLGSTRAAGIAPRRAGCIFPAAYYSAEPAAHAHVSPLLRRDCQGPSGAGLMNRPCPHTLVCAQA